MSLNGKWPGIIRQYDAARREVRVEIPGLTDGAQELPIAEIEYPIGDKSRHTEIRILEGDEVWLEFIRGDARYPVVTGWRCPAEGSDVGTRRWHHENIESDADLTQKHTAGSSYTIEAATNINATAGQSVLIEAATSINATAGQSVLIEAGTSIVLKVGGSTITIDAATIAAVAATINLNA